MAQVQLKYMDININVHSDGEKLLIKNTATFGKLIIAVYASYVYVCNR
jgi:hypothetical protein